MRAALLPMLIPFLTLCELRAGPEATAIIDAVGATYKITNKTSTSTCFLVARPAANDEGEDETILVTAAHSLDKMAGNEARLVLREKKENGEYVRKETPVRVRGEKGKPLWTKHPELDVAALRIELPKDARLSPIPLEQIAGSGANGEPEQPLEITDDVWILCYPAQLESTRAGFPVVRKGSIASYPLNPIPPERNLMISFHTFGGDSGAPVIKVIGKKKEAKPVVVGIVVGLNRQTDKTTAPFEERTMHTPLGLANAIPAKFIRDTIERIPRK